MAIPVKKNIQDWLSGKRNLLTEVGQLSKELERGIAKKKKQVGTPSQIATNLILKKSLPELPEPIRKSISLTITKTPAGRNFDKSMTKAGVTPNRVFDTAEKAGNIGLSQLRSGAMTLEAGKNIAQGGIGVGQTIPSYLKYFKGELPEGEMRNLNRELGEKGLQTGIGVLEGLGAGFRFSPFGQVTTPAENLLFGRLKQIKEGKPITEDTNLREIGRDYFISDALGIRDKYPTLSMALDIGTNLMLGKVEEDIAGKMGWKQKDVDIKKLQEEWKSIMNDPNIKEKGFIKFASDIGSGKISPEEAPKGIEDLNRITKELDPEFSRAAAVTKGSKVNTYMGDAEVIRPPNEAGDLTIRLPSGEEMKVNLNTSWKELGGTVDRPFIKRNQKTRGDVLQTVRDMLEARTSEDLGTFMNRVETPLDVVKTPTEVPAGEVRPYPMELTSKDMSTMRGLGATPEDVARTQDNIETAYKVGKEDKIPQMQEVVDKAQTPEDILKIKSTVDEAVSSGKVSQEQATKINDILYQKDTAIQDASTSKVLETGDVNSGGERSAFEQVGDTGLKDEVLQDLENGLKGADESIRKMDIPGVQGMKKLTWLERLFGDLDRNMDKIFKGSVVEPQVKAIVDDFYTAKGKYAEDIQVRHNDIRNTVVDGLGFEKGTPESGLWQEYGEGLLYRTDEELTRQVETLIDMTRRNNFGEDGQERLAKYVKENPDWYSRNYAEAPPGKVPDKEAEFLKWTFDLEKGASEDLLKRMRPDDWQRFVQADEYARALYNEYLPKANKVFDAIYPDGSHHIYALPNYYRHYWEYGKGTGLEEIFNSLSRANAELNAPSTVPEGNITKATKAVKKLLGVADKALNVNIPVDTKYKMSSDLVGITYQTRPSSRYYSPGKARTGAVDYTRDAVGGMEDYLLKTSYAIHFNPSIAKFQGLADAIRVQTAKGTDNASQYNKEIEYLVDTANDLAGKTNPFDRTVLKIFGYDGLNKIQALNNRVKKNVLLGNASTIIAQTANLPNGFGAFGTDNMTRGLQDFNQQILTGYKGEGLPPAHRSGWLDERFMKLMSLEPGSTIQKVEDITMDAMQIGDEIPTRIMWNAAYRQAEIDPKYKGLSEDELIKIADRETAKVVAGRGVGEVPLLQKSAFMRLVAPFQLEVTNQWKVMGDIGSKGGWDAAKGLTVLFLANRAFNVVYEQMMGRKVLFDPIDATVDAIRKRSPGRLAGEILGNVPFGQQAAQLYPEYGFNIPVVPGEFHIQTPTATEFFGGEAPTRFGTGILTAKSLQDPLFKILPPLGGSQVEKTIGGIGSFVRGSVKSSGGRTYTPIKQSVPNAIRSVLFGRFSYPEMKIYFESRAAPLGEKQTGEMESLNTNRQQLDYYRRILEGRKKKREAKESGESTSSGYGSYDSYDGYGSYGSY